MTQVEINFPFFDREGVTRNLICFAEFCLSHDNTVRHYTVDDIPL